MSPARGVDPFIMADTSSTLSLTARSPEGSRSARRLRRDGLVPGVIYGGGAEPTHFAVDGRILRNTLAHAHAILEISLDGGTAAPVLVKHVQRHPVRGEAMHVDLLRVDLKEKIQTTVTLELVGADRAPGVVEGGVLSQELHEVTIEALPADIPDSLSLDVSGVEMNGVLLLSALASDDKVAVIGDAETVVATVTPPTVESVDEEIETETEVVGESAPEAS